MKVVSRVLITALLLSALLIGCSRKEDKKAGGTAPVSGHTTKNEAAVVVPDSVKGKWKAVKIAVTNKHTNKESIYTVPIGSGVPLSDSGLSITVDNFLPHFVMEGTTLTSQSNEPKNPAAQIRILDHGKEIFKGWLFSLYPTTHAFQHPQYGFTLVDFIPAH